MTQALVNNLNMLTQNTNDVEKKKNSQKFSSDSYMDNTSDFQDVFDQKVNKHNTQSTSSNTKNSTDTTNVTNPITSLNSDNTENDINKNSDAPNFITGTIGYLKEKISQLTSSNDLINFKQIIENAAGEANLENALDLTLSKDINNIIEEFKEVLEPTIDTAVEDLQEDTKEVIIPDENAITTDTVQIIASQPVDEVMQDITLNSNDESLVLTDTDINKISKVTLDNTSDNNYENTEILTQDEYIDIFDEPTTIETKTLMSDITKKVDNNITDENRPEIEENVVKELNIKSIKAETSNSDNNDSLMQNQTPEEHAVKIILNQDSASFERTLNVQNIQETSKPVEISPNKIIEQITKQLEGLQNNSRVSIVLNPESLGKINIQLVKTAEGLMAQFTVDSAEAKEILMKGLDGLKENLLSQGIGVDNVSVKLNDTQKSSYNPDWTEQEDSEQNQKEQNRKNKDKNEKEQFEKLMAQNELNQNGEV